MKSLIVCENYACANWQTLVKDRFVKEFRQMSIINVMGRSKREIVWPKVSCSVREEDAECNESQYAGGPWEPGAHGAGLALLFISLILQRRKPVPSDRRTFLSGLTWAQTFNPVRPAQEPAGRLCPLGGDASSWRTLIGFSVLLLYVPSHCNATQVLQSYWSYLQWDRNLHSTCEPIFRTVVHRNKHHVNQV